MKLDEKIKGGNYMIKLYIERLLKNCHSEFSEQYLMLTSIKNYIEELENKVMKEK